MIDRMFPMTSAPQARTSRQQILVVPEGGEIEGSVRAQGSARIEGIITGRLEALSVTVARRGEVHGVIAAEEVIVEGLSTADIYAKRIVLKPGATVTGEIYHEDLLIEQSALFEGKSRRVRDPHLLAPAVVEVVDGDAPTAASAASLQAALHIT